MEGDAEKKFRRGSARVRRRGQLGETLSEEDEGDSQGPFVNAQPHPNLSRLKSLAQDGEKGCRRKHDREFYNWRSVGEWKGKERRKDSLTASLVEKNFKPKESGRQGLKTLLRVRRILPGTTIEEDERGVRSEAVLAV